MVSRAVTRADRLPIVPPETKCRRPSRAIPAARRARPEPRSRRGSPRPRPPTSRRRHCRARGQVERDGGAGRGGGDVGEVQRVVLGAGGRDQDAVEDVQRRFPADPLGRHRAAGRGRQLGRGARGGLRVTRPRDPVGHPAHDAIDCGALVAPERLGVGVGRRHGLILAGRRAWGSEPVGRRGLMIPRTSAFREAMIRSRIPKLIPGDMVTMARSGRLATTASTMSSMLSVLLAANWRFIPHLMAATRRRPARLVSRSVAVEVRVNGRMATGAGIGLPSSAANSASVATGPAGAGTRRERVVGLDVDVHAAVDVGRARRRRGSRTRRPRPASRRPRRPTRRTSAGSRATSTRAVCPGSRRTFANPASSLAGRGTRRLDVAHVDLHDLAPGRAPVLVDVHRHGQVGAHPATVDLAVGEGRVAQPVAEGEARGHAVRVVEPVADVEALAVLHLARVAREVARRRAGARRRPGSSRRAARRARRPEQHVGQRRAAGLAAEVGLDQRGRPVGPGELERAAVARARRLCAGSRRARTSTRWSIPAGSRRSRRGPRPRSPGARGQADDEHDVVGRAGQRGGLAPSAPGWCRRWPGRSRRRSGPRPARRLRRQGVEQRVDPGGVDLRAAAALVAGLDGERADRPRACPSAGSGQQPVVGEQHGARGGGAAGQGVVGVEVRRRGRSGVAERPASAAPAPPRGRPTRSQVGLGQAPSAMAAAISASKAPAPPGISRSIPAAQAGHAVVGAAPVGHDQPVEAPLPAQHLARAGSSLSEAYCAVDRL